MEDGTHFIWLPAVSNVDGIWSVRQATLEVSGRRFSGCTVDTVVIERGSSFGVGDNCGQNIYRDDLHRLVMVDITRKMV